MKKKKIMSIVMSAAVTASMTLASFAGPDGFLPGLRADAAVVSFENSMEEGELGYIRQKPYKYSSSMYNADETLEYKAVDVDLDNIYDCIEIVRGADTLTEIEIPKKFPLEAPPKEPNRAYIEADNPNATDEEIDAEYDKQYSNYLTSLNKYNSDYQTALNNKAKTDKYPFVRLISANAFSECNALSKVDIPDTVYWIGGDAFEGTPWLEEQRDLAMSNPASTKGMVIFNHILLDGRRCEGLISDTKNKTELSIPANVTSIADRAFYNNNSLETYGEFDDEGEYHVGTCRYETHTEIDEFGDEVEVEKKIETSLPAFVIPSNISSIGSEAFYGCSSITNVKFDANIKSIGNMSFAECSSLEEVNDSAVSYLDYLGYQAFLNTPWLDHIAEKVSGDGGLGYRQFGNEDDGVFLLDGSCASGDVRIYVRGEQAGINYIIKAIPAYSFMGNATMTSITIPNTISVIGEHAFEDCSGLTEFKTVKNVSYSPIKVGPAIFKDCISLESCSLPISAEVPDELFSGCSNLRAYSIPLSVKKIGKEAFLDCGSLKSINIPTGVTSIGERAFDGTEWLEDQRLKAKSNNYLVVVPLSNKTKQLLLDGKSAVGEVDIPSNVTDIQSYAFQDNISITDVNIGQKVKTIGEGAFDGCSSLEGVTIRSDSIDIADNALSDFNGTIYCNKNSKAHTYAKNNDIAYEFITSATTEATTTTTTTTTTASKATSRSTSKSGSTSKATSRSTSKTTSTSASRSTAGSAVSSSSKTVSNTTETTASKTSASTASNTTSKTSAGTTAAATSRTTASSSTAAKDTTSAATTSANTTASSVSTVSHVTSVSTEASSSSAKNTAFAVTTTASAATSKTVTESTSDKTTEETTSTNVTTTVPVSSTSSVSRKTTAKTTDTAYSSSTSTTGTTTVTTSATSKKTTAKTTETAGISTTTVTTIITTTIDTDAVTGVSTTTLTSAAVSSSVTSSKVTTTARSRVTTSDTAASSDSKTTTVKATSTAESTSAAVTTTANDKVTNAKNTTTTSAKATTTKATTTTIAKVTTTKATTATSSKVTTTKATTTTNSKVTTGKATTTTNVKVTTTKATTTTSGKVTTTKVTTSNKVTTSKTSATSKTTRTTKTSKTSVTSVTTTTPVTTSAATTTTKPDRVQNIGDSNNDGKLNVRDAAYIARMLASNRADELGSLCDFNGDGKVNVRDAAAIARYLAITARRN